MIIDSQNVIHPSLQTPEELLAGMDRAGIDMAVVYCRSGAFYDNDYTAMAVRQHPDRLIGFSYINPRRDSTRFELERTQELGLIGITLNPKYDEYSLSIDNHWFMDSIFSFCSEKGLIVLGEGYGDSHFSMPYQFRDVAWTFPDLKIILAHMGMFGGYDDVHRVAKLCPNVYVNTSTTTSQQTQIAREIAGPEKMLLGTDTPVEYFEVSLKKVEIAVPDLAQRRLVLGENARQLFGIKTR
jgi:uncharacterized protein